MEHNFFRDGIEPSRADDSFPKFILPLVLVLVPTLYFTKELSSLRNGMGGENWRIGAPLTTLANGYQQRSLPQLQEFALLLVNRDRAVNRSAPLIPDPLLAQAAQLHAQDMLAHYSFGRHSPAGKTASQRFYELGGNPAVGVAENIFWSREPHSPSFTYREVENIQTRWMYSEDHRDRLLAPEYTRFGYGMAADPITKHRYAVQLFAGAEVVPAPE